MNRLLYLLFIVFLLSGFAGCKKNRLKVDISELKENVEVVRFDNELFSLTRNDTTNAIVELSNRYPEFFNLFTYKVIQIGGIGDEYFMDAMKLFLADTMIFNVKTLVEEEFSDFDKIGKQLNSAFKYYKYHFPKKEVPTIYTYVSGFNQSVVTAENIIGIGLDKYLGRDCKYYKLLSSTPMYKILNMYKEKIPADVAYAWGVTEFEHTNTATTVLDNMIHKGKLLYFVDALLPEMHDSVKIGYTALQLDWCKKNEAQMWSQLIEQKMLYSNNRMDIVRYTNDGPRTSGFPLESPGRAGVWIGWQIVREYMDKFPETTLPDLMKNTDYQQILNDSKYFPE
jgi:gliding motility-associated lipoprotein GldB